MIENGFLPASRSITAVKVDATAPDNPKARVRIEWNDGAGERQHIERTGKIASEIITDLHACTLVSEGIHTGYLIGLIRGTTLRGHNVSTGGG